MLRASLTTVLTLVAFYSKPVAADDNCYTMTYSDASLGPCEWAKVRETDNRVTQALNLLLLKARQNFPEDLFSKDIESNQTGWETWAHSECKLEGGITMGTAAIVIEPVCRQRLDVERVQSLDAMRSSIS